MRVLMLILIALFVFGLLGCATHQNDFLLAVRGTDHLYAPCTAVVAFATPAWQFWQAPQKFVACRQDGLAFISEPPSASAIYSSLGSIAAKITPTIPIAPAP